jgi:hypothetical protein
MTDGIVIDFKCEHSEKHSEPKDSTESRKLIDSREEHFQKHLFGISLIDLENVRDFKFKHSEKQSGPKDSTEPPQVIDSREEHL